MPVSVAATWAATGAFVLSSLFSFRECVLTLARPLRRDEFSKLPRLPCDNKRLRAPARFASFCRALSKVTSVAPSAAANPAQYASITPFVARFPASSLAPSRNSDSAAPGSATNSTRGSSCHRSNAANASATVRTLPPMTCSFVSNRNRPNWVTRQNSSRTFPRPNPASQAQAATLDGCNPQLSPSQTLMSIK